MRSKDSPEEKRLSVIRQRWRARNLVLEWQSLPKELRADVLGELEENALFVQGDGGRARSIAADAWEAMQSPLLLDGLESIYEDVQFLLAEIERLRR